VELSGCTALVTGAGVRIGREIALGLARSGMDVAVHYRHSQRAAEQVAEEVRALGRRAVTLEADLENLEQVQALIPAAAESLGAVDVLVNSAAVFERGTLASTTPENWSRHMDVNLRAPFFLSQAYAARLPAHRRGHIINLTDWRAFRPGIQHMAYILSKSALVTLTRSLALALGPQVQVNALALGAVMASPGEESYFERLAMRLPLGRTGDAQDVVQAVLYLLNADYVTGEVLHLTGGEHL